MKLNRIKQTVNETILLIKKQKWTRKKTIPLIMIGLLVVFFLVFLNGNSGGYEYIKVGEQHYTEKIVAVGQLGMENQNEIVSQVNGKVDFIGAEEGGTISAGAIIISIKNPE